MSKVYKRGKEAHRKTERQTERDIYMHQFEPSMRDEEVLRQDAELWRRAEEIDTRQVQMALGSQESIRCPQQLEIRL